MATNIDVGGFIGSTFDGDKAIDKIIQAEKKKRTPIEIKQFKMQLQKEAWSGLQKKLSDLNTTSRNLYSPLYSPFRKIHSQSSDANLLEVIEDKVDPSKLKPGSYNVIPKQMAKSDHFRSDALKLEDSIPAGQFSIIYHQKKYNISFAGGTIQELQKAISDVIGTFANVQVLNIGDNSNVLDIEAKEVGKKNAFTFEGNIDFLKKIGLLKNAHPNFENLNLTQKEGLRSNKDIADILSENQLLLDPQDTITKVFSLPKIIKKDSELWIYLKATKTNNKNLPSEASSPNLSTNKDHGENPITGLIDKVWVGDAQLLGEELLLTDITNPLEAEKNLSKNKRPSEEAINPHTKLVIVLETSQGKIQKEISYKENLPRLQIIKIPIEEGTLNALTLTNAGQDQLSISKGEIKTSNKGTFVPKNSLSKAQNAIVKYNGQDYERESNTISDVVPGATLVVKGESSHPVKVDIHWDYDLILEKIKEFVTAYNNVMDYIKHVGKLPVSDPSRSALEEMVLRKEKYEKLTEKEKKEAGFDGSLYDAILFSDLTVHSIKSKIQDIAVAPYDTDIKQKLMFLSQLGIKKPGFNDVNSSSKEDEENFRAGYLEFTKEDEKKFQSILKENYQAVQQLFFKRSHPSQILYDKGLAVEMNHLLEKMVASNYRGEDKRVYSGLVKAKIDILDNQIHEQSMYLNQFDKKLEKQKQKLQNDFGKVYRAQSQAKAAQSQLSRFSN